MTQAPPEAQVWTPPCRVRSVEAGGVHVPGVGAAATTRGGGTLATLPPREGALWVVARAR